MAPPDGGLHITLTEVDDICTSDVSVGSLATGRCGHGHGCKSACSADINSEGLGTMQYTSPEHNTWTLFLMNRS